MNSDNFLNYQRFCTLIATGQPIPIELAIWWQNAVDSFERGKTKTLCLALGIRGAGIRSFKMREFYRRRNILFKFALSTCTRYPGETVRSKCHTLAEQINRLPRLRNPDPLLIDLQKLYAEHDLVFKINSAGILKAIKKT